MKPHGGLSGETCAEIFRRQIPVDSHASFVRGVLYGFGGIVTDLVIGEKGGHIHWVDRGLWSLSCRDRVP